MRNIVKNSSITSSESILARLCSKTFLDLWSFQNIHTDDGLAKLGQGKELCDLLVVFGEHIFIFSDKGHVSFNEDIDVLVAWKRWAKKAIFKSAYQVFQAEKWILEFPERIFVDKKCTEKFPINLPSKDKAKIHRIIITRGISNSVKNVYNDNSGSLMINAAFIGDENYAIPFNFGFIDESKRYVHIFNDEYVDLVFDKLDTITDFAAYLEEKEKFLSGPQIVSASGEDELIGAYLSSRDIPGHINKPSFDYLNEFANESQVDAIHIGYGGLESANKVTINQKIEQDRQYSELWDYLINTWGKTAFSGKWYETTGTNYDEEILVLKFMASESRLSRIVLSRALGEILKKPFPPEEVLPRVRVAESPQRDDSCYIFLIMPHTSEFKTIEEYRNNRKNAIFSYCLACKDAFPKYDYIYGLAMNPLEDVLKSEEFVYLIADQENWTEEMAIEAKKVREDNQLLVNVKQAHNIYYAPERNKRNERHRDIEKEKKRKRKLRQKQSRKNRK